MNSEVCRMENKRFPLLFAVAVFLSGIAGLSYELIWIRSIKGYFGSEIFSVSLVVAIYFGGMGLGGILGSRLLKRGFGALRLYGGVEAGLAGFGLLFPLFIRWIHQLYLGSASLLPASLWIVSKAVLTVILLVVPTTLIGITLPLIAAIAVQHANVFTTRFSRFYGLNTFGAVAGCLITGFLFIPVFGLSWSGRLIALVNLAVAGLCYFMDRQNLFTPGEDVYHDQSWKQAVFPGLIAFLMGFLSLTYEVVWIRIFGFYFISSSVSLAVLLSMFLIGLALGSTLLSLWKKPVSVTQLACIELVKALMMIMCFLMVRHVFYHGWADITKRFGDNPGFGQLLLHYILFGSLAFLLPAMMMGMTFPLLERTWLSSKAGSAHVVGMVSAWNTWGGTLGAALAGLVFISAMGSTITFFLAVGLSVLVGLLLLIYSHKTLWGIIPVVAAAVLFIVLPREMNYMRRSRNLKSYEYYHEGRGGSVSIMKNQFGEKTLYVGNAYVLGGTSFQGIRIQQRQGALPMVLAPSEAKRVLKIGLGTGITLRGMVENQGVAEADAVEIVPEVIQVLNHFATDNNRVYQKRNVKIHEGDGREFLATSKNQYDVILGELYTPQYAGTGNLYSVEHLKQIQSHLTPEGIFCQWIQMAQFSHETFRIVVRTFLEVFADGSLWIVNTDVQKPVAALIASNNMNWSEATLQQGLDLFSRRSGDVLSWGSSSDVAAHFVTDDLWPLTEGEERINTLDQPWIEEMAPRKMVSPDESPLEWVCPYRQWPDRWQGWQAGYEIWQGFGQAQQTALDLFSDIPRDPLFIHSVEETVRSLPSTPTLNMYRAEILINFVQALLNDPDIPQSSKLRDKTIIPLTRLAVAADPGNYTYRYNLLMLYRSARDKKNFDNTLLHFWMVLPAHLKHAPAFHGLDRLVDQLQHTSAPAGSG